MAKEELGVQHRIATDTRAALAAILVERGQLDEAEMLQRLVLAARQRVLGPEHVHTLKTCEELVKMLRRRGAHVEGMRLQLEAMRASENAYGREHHVTMTAAANLAATLHTMGRLDIAEALQHEVLGYGPNPQIGKSFRHSGNL